MNLVTHTLPHHMGSQGGAAIPDGGLDNNDYVVFFDYFFASNPKADLGQQGGIPAIIVCTSRLLGRSLVRALLKVHLAKLPLDQVLIPL
jgi:hypothetical protein